MTALRCAPHTPLRPAAPASPAGPPDLPGSFLPSRSGPCPANGGTSPSDLPAPAGCPAGARPAPGRAGSAGGPEHRVDPVVVGGPGTRVTAGVVPVHAVRPVQPGPQPLQRLRVDGAEQAERVL